MDPLQWKAKSGQRLSAISYLFRNKGVDRVGGDSKLESSKYSHFSPLFTFIIDFVINCWCHRGHKSTSMKFIWSLDTEKKMLT